MKEQEEYQMVVLPKSVYEAILSELKEIKILLQKKSEEEIKEQWIESTQVRKILGVSVKTWQTYRDERRIPFTQFGRKILVKRADLDKFMEDNHVDMIIGDDKDNLPKIFRPD